MHADDPGSLIAIWWGREHDFFLGPTCREARGIPARAGLPGKPAGRAAVVPLVGIPWVAASEGSSCKSRAWIAAGPAGRSQRRASFLLTGHHPNTGPMSGLMLCILTQRRKALELLIYFFFPPPPLYMATWEQTAAGSASLNFAFLFFSFSSDVL